MTRLASLLALGVVAGAGGAASVATRGVASLLGMAVCLGAAFVAGRLLVRWTR